MAHHKPGETVSTTTKKLWTTKTMNRLISAKDCVLPPLVASSETRKSQKFSHWLKKGNPSTIIWQNSLFLSSLLASLQNYARKDWKCCICIRCKFWSHRFIQQQRYKVLGNLWRLIWRDLDIESWIAITRRHCGLSTNYFRHYLFRQSRLGRHLEHKNTLLVLSIPSRWAMKVTTLSTQLGIESKLNDWYLAAMSVRCEHLLFDFVARRGNRLRHCAKTWPIMSKFFIPDRLKQPTSLDEEQTKFLNSPSVPAVLPHFLTYFL